MALYQQREAYLARLAGHVLMPIQDHLSGEWRMSADFDRDVAPLGIEDMKRVVVHIGLLPLQVVVDAHIPYRRLGAADQNEKQTLRDFRLCQVFFGQLMFAFSNRTIHNRNALRFGKPANTPAEASRTRWPKRRDPNERRAHSAFRFHQWPGN